jgi:hypothetical protein
MCQIINHNDILKIPILNNPEILNKETVLSLHAILAMQETLNRLLLLIQVGNDRLSVVQSSSCEDIDIIVVTHVRQKLKAIRSNIELEFISLTGKADISFIVGEYRVNERLIEI